MTGQPEIIFHTSVEWGIYDGGGLKIQNFALGGRGAIKKRCHAKNGFSTPLRSYQDKVKKLETKFEKKKIR